MSVALIRKMADILWQQAQSLITAQVQREQYTPTKKLKSDQLAQLNLAYFQCYMEIFNLLTRALALQTHPQKRLALRKTLDAVTARLLETRQVICLKNRTWGVDFQQLLNSPFAHVESLRAVNYNATRRNQLFKILYDRYKPELNASLFDAQHYIKNYVPGAAQVIEAGEEKYIQQMTMEEAILLLQRAERGRTARLRAKLVRDIVKTSQTQDKKDVIVNRAQAAECIQRFWRGRLRKVKVDEKRKAELKFLGLCRENDASVFPMVENLVSQASVKAEKERAAERQALIDENVNLLQKSLFKHKNEDQVEILAPLPMQMQASLCPMANHSDPKTVDPMESLYSLSREIDKQNIKAQPESFELPRNLPDSGLPVAPQIMRQRVLKLQAEFMLTHDFRKIIYDRGIRALAFSQEVQFDQDKQFIEAEVLRVEGEELKQALRHRYELAIQQFRDDPENESSTYPVKPPVILTADEQALYDYVVKDEAERFAALKKKGKKGKKGKSSGTAAKKGKDEEIDPDLAAVEHLSWYVNSLVDSSIEYFNRWQRLRETDDLPYETSFVKEIIRPGIFKKVFDAIYDEMEGFLKEIAEAYYYTSDMDAKKKKKPFKAPKLTKRKVYDFPPQAQVGPVGLPDVEAAYAELVQNSVVKLPKPALLCDFVAAEAFMSPGSLQSGFLMNYAKEAVKKLGLTPKLQELDAEPERDLELPSYAALKDYIVYDVLLPLYVPLTRFYIARPTKLLLVGAPGSGKTMLARVIATELNAIFIDVSPANLLGKFPGSEISYLFKQIRTIIQNNDPVVVYCDEIELVLASTVKATGKAKKKPKEDDGQTPGASMLAEGYAKTADPKFSPARMKKEILALIKAIYNTDGAVFIGASSRTYLREKALVDLFQTFVVYLQLPDYNQRVKLLSHFLTRYGCPEFGFAGVGTETRVLAPTFGAADGQHGDYNALGMLGIDSGYVQKKSSAQAFNFSSVVRMLEGYTAGQIEEVVGEILTEKRLLQLHDKPLQSDEFVEVLSRKMPHFDSKIAHMALMKMVQGKELPVLEEPVEPKK